MKTKLNQLLYSLLAISVLSITSCDKNDHPILPEEPQTAVSGVYIINDGFSGTDNASLSYFDLKTSEMKNNVFQGANPANTLGDEANDGGIYGSKLYITVTNSNKVEILDAMSGRILKTVDMNLPRYIAFYGKYAFISSYTNSVFVMDTASMTINKEIEVGRTPEQLAVSGDQIFVANAGWKDRISGGEYDNRVSVIDGKSLVKVRDIEVADNIDRVYTDDRGHVFVNASTIFHNVPPYDELSPSRLYVIDAKTGTVDTLAFGANLMAINGQTAYLISGNYEAGKTQFLEMNTSTFAVKPVALFSGENIQNFNGLAVDPDSGDLWVSGYNEYGSLGKVYRYQVATEKVDSYAVGYFPKTFAFKR